MNPLKSVGARLSLALAVVVAAALGLTYVILVPSLERNLIHSKLAQLRRTARIDRAQLSPIDQFTLNDTVSALSETTSARIVVLQQLLGPKQLLTFSESTGNGVNAESDTIAVRAAEERRLVSGTVEFRDQRYAEAAVPVGESYVLLLSSHLGDTLANVRLVRRRLLIAG